MSEDPTRSESETPAEGTATPSPASLEPDRAGRESESTPPRAPHRVRDTFVTLGIGFMAFLVGLGLFNFLVMPRLIHGGDTITVPGVTSLTLEQAERALDEAGLQLSRAGERFDEAAPRGVVLSQDPAEGTPVRGRSLVSVVVSLGEENASVPELAGESRRAAALLLERSGLAIGAITRTPSATVAEGLIAASDPAAEALVPRGAKVALLISTGVPEENWVMPDLSGREISGARRQLEAMGFRVVTPPAAPNIGAIVMQSPLPGSRLTRDTEILLQAMGRVIQ